MIPRILSFAPGEFSRIADIRFLKRHDTNISSASLISILLMGKGRKKNEKYSMYYGSGELNRMLDDLDPPIEDLLGHWEWRTKFTGRKSFGHYRCSCDNTWVSAWAQPIYKQACKKCGTKRYPIFMWVNQPGRHRRDNEFPQEETRPHLSHLCEACKAGDCLNSYTF